MDSSKKRTVRHLDSESSDSEKDEKDIEYEDPFVDAFEDEEIPNPEDLEDEEDDDEGLEYIEKYKNMKLGDLNEEEEEEDEGPIEPYVGDGKTEKLEFRNDAYSMLHRMGIQWPCLSLDIIRDDKGYGRTKFPMECYVTCGTQAEDDQSNRVYFMKMTELHRTEFDSDEEADIDVDEDGLDDEPVLVSRFFKHYGSVNRIRSMPQTPNIVATWSSTGIVHFWDAKSLLLSLGETGKESNHAKEIQKLTHKTEGFAMDWSPVKTGLFACGDISGNISVLIPQNGGKWSIANFNNPNGSIEDIKWSPEGESVFATCGTDKMIHIWDVRKPKPALSFFGSDTDINAMSWNAEVQNLIASGDEDGTLRVWDLRSQGKNTKSDPIAQLKYHKDQITSVEWNPNDSSVIACCGDDKTTIWDLSVESEDSTETFGLPPQLMFIHQGQDHVKELKWHPQLPHVVVTCAYDSINIFKGSNFHEDEKKQGDEEIFEKGDDEDEDVSE